MNALEIKNISYTYRSDWLLKSKEALHDLSLTVNEGEIFGFIGHNGAGKTTTIKCVLSLIKPKTGEIKIFNIDAKDPNSRKNIGYLSEQPYFYDNIKVSELLLSLATLSGLSKKESHAALDEALTKVKLGTEYIKSPLRSLSKGLLQRVAMAGAIIHKPKLLILDEPFSGLDPIGRNDFATLLRTLNQEHGTTIFLSSHILSDVEALSSRVAIIKQGKLEGIYNTDEITVSNNFELTIAAEGATEEFAKHGVRSGNVIKLSYSDEKSAKSALAQALALGIPIKSYHACSGSLEELFIKLNQRD